MDKANRSAFPGARRLAPREATDSPPLRVLEMHLDREAVRLAEREREIRASREALAALVARSTDTSDRAAEPLAAVLAPELIQRLLEDCDGPTRSYVMVTDSGPALDAGATRATRARIEAGFVQYTLYPSAALTEPRGAAWIAEWAEIGERQRLIAVPETEFAIFGDLAVVSLATWGDPTSGYVLLEHPLIVAAFTAYFDQVWRSATPVSADLRAPTDDERLVELLQLGIKDEAISRYLGIGLRTVRRRIAGLMAAHGAETRFQLGWALRGQASGTGDGQATGGNGIPR